MTDSNSELATEIKRLVKVFAYAQIKDEKTERQARFLKAVGLTTGETADLLGKSQRVVQLALAKAKKEEALSE